MTICEYVNGRVNVTIAPLTFAIVHRSVWSIRVSVVVKTISSPATQSTGWVNVICVWPADAVVLNRVHETFRGIPFKSRPPKTPITFGPIEPASFGKRTLVDDEPVITISTFPVNGLFGQPAIKRPPLIKILSALRMLFMP